MSCDIFVDTSINTTCNLANPGEHKGIADSIMKKYKEGVRKGITMKNDPETCFKQLVSRIEEYKNSDSKSPIHMYIEENMTFMCFWERR